LGKYLVDLLVELRVNKKGIGLVVMLVDVMDV